MNNDLSRQMQSVKPQNPKMHHVTSAGVSIQGLVDIVYINLTKHQTLAEKKNPRSRRHKDTEPHKYAFLMAIDVLSRYRAGYKNES